MNHIRRGEQTEVQASINSVDIESSGLSAVGTTASSVVFRLEAVIVNSSEKRVPANLKRTM